MLVSLFAAGGQMKDQSTLKSAMDGYRAGLQGYASIQSYCLGHTDFAACSAFAQCQGKEALLSGSGDGTVRSVSCSCTPSMPLA